jgi:cGMP-dependent protein kinase 2
MPCLLIWSLQLPANVCSDPALLVASPADALTAAMLSTNSQLHAAPIDDSLSGTTACSMVVAGRKLYVANVGDSRAVLAERSERQGEGLVACELSMDQTPFR